MRVNINLASQKYEEVRQFYVRWGSAVAATAVLTVLLLTWAGRNYLNSAKTNGEIKQLDQQLAVVEQQRASAEAFANRPENHDITEQKNFWNGEIVRRSFSWTQLFNDLQRIMPARAYVNSVHPELTLDHRLKLNMVILSDKHDNALELVRRMEKSDRFHDPLPGTELTEKDPHNPSMTLYRFDITTYYTPAGAPLLRTVNKESM
jgi:hypothetical protein